MRFCVSLVALALLATAPALAQEADTLTVEDGWVNRLDGSLQASQAAYRDWQQGGINALAAGALVDGAFDRLAGRIRLHHDVRAALSVVQQDTLAVRKADDLLRYGFTAERRTEGLLHPTAAFSAQSQFAPGFDFAPDPARYPTLTITPGSPLRVSQFAAPAYFTQSLGVTARPGGGLVARAGLGVKETLVSIARLRPVYGNAPDETLRIQAGLDAEVRLERPLAENVSLRSRLLAFQAFNQVGNAAPDLAAEATVLMRVNSLLNVTLDGGALYDADILDRVQLRQRLAIGMVVSLL